MLIQPQADTDTTIISKVGPFDVDADNYDAVCLYLACQTQWVKQYLLPPMGGNLITLRQGLNYHSVAMVMNHTPQFRESRDAQLFAKLQVMEFEALNFFAETG